MTWDQLQQLRSAAQGRIQQRMEKVQPRSGKGAIVSGGSIALQADRRDYKQEEQPWNLAIYATIHVWGENRDEDGSVVFYRDRHEGPEVAAHFLHPPVAQMLYHSSICMGSARFYHIIWPQGSGAYSWRKAKITFEALAFSGDQIEPYEDGTFRFPVEITVGYISDESYELNKPVKPVKTKTLRIGRNGVSYTFEPPQQNVFYRPQIMEARRI